MHPRAQEFKELVATEYGIEIEIEEFPEGTKTAADAAKAVGCDVAQIASGIVLDAAGELIVSVTSGANRVDTVKIAERFDANPGAVSMADAGEIKSMLGWSIGGVPPLCHESDVPVIIDKTLLTFDSVWAAAGTPKAVFEVDPERLAELADAEAVDVAEE